MGPSAAVACHLLLQAVAMLGGWLVSRRATPHGRTWLLGAAACFLTLNLLLADGALLLALLPLRDLALFGNQTPLAAGLFAGLALGAAGLPWWRRMLVAALLVLVADIAVCWPLLRPIPVTADLWSDDACLQTTESTCAPAAAATLLRLSGITADEATLARWCLTSQAGTTHWGLWRGLRALSDGTPWAVRAGDPGVDAVLAGPPAIVSVVLTKDLDRRDPRYRKEWGWILGQPHAVVYLGPGSKPGLVRIADPKVGVEEWDESGLRELWNGQAFWLVRR